MFQSSGSILPLQSKTALSKVNLLIITNTGKNFQKIVVCLKANSHFDYEWANAEGVTDCSHRSYSAIVYDYHADHTDLNFLIEQLQWWSHQYPDLPLILITEELGDEAAIELTDSGVDGYVLRHRLELLVPTVEKCLFEFSCKRAISKQQTDLIEQQQTQIQSLQALVKSQNETIAARDTQLEQQQKQIQSWIDGEQTKQEDLAHLNHELRSPISSMLGFAGMLKEQYYGELNERQMRYVNAMMSVGQYMLDLVNNYLDIAKIDANKQTLDREKLVVAEVCQNALLCVEEKAAQKNLKLELDLEDELDFCVADSRCLRQILINLLSNAVKFTEHGSITLRVKQDRESIYFAVIDTGVGISAENIDKLFKPFPQISNHRESTGLGLALSRKLARLHDGDLVAISSLGEGSCFTLSIPQTIEPT